MNTLHFTKNRSLFFLLILAISSWCYTASNTPLVVHTIYNDIEVTEPVLIDLMYSAPMQRIKHIHQYGATDYVIPQNKEYTRHEHCLGVWALLRMYGASLEEQIAGLLHDASHTVFSHVGDILFEHTSTHNSYQDDIHQWYLEQQHIDALLQQHNLSLEAVLHKSGNHHMLEQNLPNICADRLEYNLQAGLLTDLLTLDDIHLILADLKYNDGAWFFTDVECAKKLALVSLFNTEFVWGGPQDHFINENMANALKRALHIGLLTNDDIHFSVDDVIWDILRTTNDPIITTHMNNIMHYKKIIAITDIESGDFVVKSKFRGLDPLIATAHGLQRLTNLNDDYKSEYNRVKQQVTDGWYVRLQSIDNQL